MNKPMNDNTKDGGPAFPMSGDPNVDFDRGMSLRDYFAGQALVGLYSSGDLDLAVHSKRKSTEREDLSRMCYAVADDMLAARQL